MFFMASGCAAAASAIIICMIRCHQSHMHDLHFVDCSQFSGGLKLLSQEEEDQEQQQAIFSEQKW
jgi:hypothetical protein